MIFLKRIALILFLVGSLTLFCFWSTNEFNKVVDNLSDSYVASAHLSYQSIQKLELASTSPEMLDELSTSTDETILDIDSVATNLETATTSNSLGFSLTFPQKDDKVYIGCTYPISWQSSTEIDSLDITLISAGTREEVGPIASGLEKENTIAKEIQNLKWKVGGVWAGEYYMKVSKTNGVETVFRSNIFEINKMSENISDIEKETICKGSGGLL